MYNELIRRFESPGFSDAVQQAHSQKEAADIINKLCAEWREPDQETQNETISIRTLANASCTVLSDLIWALRIVAERVHHRNSSVSKEGSEG